MRHSSNSIGKHEYVCDSTSVVWTLKASVAYLGGEDNLSYVRVSDSCDRAQIESDLI